MLKNITLYVEKDYDALSKRAALIFAIALQENHEGNYGFATGSTPVGMYDALIEMHKAGEIDLSKVTAYNLDEYYPIQKDNDQSYDYFMAANLFDAVGLPKKRRNIPNGEAPNPTVEAADYETKLEKSGGIELQILGIGHNGHIGFNEPAQAFSCKTAYLPLTEVTIQANARFFADESEVPKHAITMGIHAIMMAKRVLLLVSGSAKAAILHDALKGPITPLVPASILQLHPNVIVVADAEAAAILVGQ